MGGKGKDASEITKIRDGTIISLFDKTDEPTGETDIFCPHFWELKYANGCKYDCQWCYLNGVYRYNAWGKKPRLKDTQKIIQDTKDILKKLKVPTMFNVGEVADGQVFPNSLIRDVIPLFANEFSNPNKHKLLILTKDDTKKVIYAVANPKNIVLAYSINAKAVSEQYELMAPHPWERLEAAKMAYRKGFEVRLRIDPMVPVNRWDLGYRELIKQIMKTVPHASIITLGSPRGLVSTIVAGKKLNNDMSWTNYLTDKSNWGLRVPHKTRVEMFSFAIQELEDAGYKGKIAICKEPLKVWNDCGLKIDVSTKCNCLI